MKRIFFTLLILFITVISYAGQDIATLDIDKLDGAAGTVTQTITNGVTATSPSEDAVFDALALKATLASPTFTGILTIPAGTVAAPSIVSDDADSGFYFGSKGFNWGADGVKAFGVSANGTVTSAYVYLGTGVWTQYDDTPLNLQNRNTTTARNMVEMATGSATFTGFDGEIAGAVIKPTVGIMDAGDTMTVLTLAPVSSVNHTGGTLRGIEFGNITGDADATEDMLSMLGTGWDNNIKLSIGGGTYYHLINSSAAEVLAGEDLRIGLDESLRTLIIADRGDIGTDFGLTASTNPRLRIYTADMTSNSALTGTSMVFSGIMTLQTSINASFQYTADTTATSIFSFAQSAATNELTASATNQAFVSLTPEYLQTATASATDMLIAPVITSIGSGESIGLQISRGTFATADAVNSTNSMIKIDGTLGILDGTDIWNGLNIAPVDTANHTGGTINGIITGNITGDPNATETMLNLTGSGWDNQIKLSAGGGTYYHFIDSSAAEVIAGEDLRIGLDESNRTLIIADRGDIGTDFGLTASANPVLKIYTAAGITPITIGNNVLTAAYAINQTNTITGFVNIRFNYGDDISTSPVFSFTQQLSTYELTASAINQAFVSMTPEYLQTSTASATDLLIAPVITSIGSGESIGLQISRGTFATADAVNSANSMIKIDGTLGILDGTDDWTGLHIAPTDTANHTGGTINGIKFGGITADTNATEIMVNLSETTPSWDADLIRSNKAISCAGAVCTDVAGAYAVYLTSTGADVLTVADGVAAGQEKFISHKVDGGSVTVTPTNFSAGTSITMLAAGNTALLHWNGTKWDLVVTYGGTVNP